MVEKLSPISDGEGNDALRPRSRKLLFWLGPQQLNPAPFETRLPGYFTSKVP